MAKSKKSPEDKPKPVLPDVTEDAAIQDQNAAQDNKDALAIEESASEVSQDGDVDLASGVADDLDVSSDETLEANGLETDLEASLEDAASEDSSFDDELTDPSVEDEPPAESSLTPPPAPVVVEKKRSIVPALIGGALCVGIGYAGANFLKPEGWPFPGSNTGAVEARLEAIEAELAASQARAADLSVELEASQNTLSSNLSEQIAAIDITSSLTPLQDAISELSTRVTTVEAAPVAEAIVSPEATAAYQRQLADMRALLDAEVARLTQAKAEAEQEEENAAAASAAARLQEAVATGMPFSDILSNIEVDVPDALSAHAEHGVASLQTLADEFSAAADIAIVETAKIETPDQTLLDKFLRTQLGMRSLTPQDGTTPDAILSRAEQAIRDIDLQVALDEISTLPDVGQAALADWTARATSRLDVTTALTSMLAQ